MEPIPETAEAVTEFGPFGDGDVLDLLRDRSEQVRELVPDCIGISVASMEHGVSFTVVATDEEIASLDGVQYLDGGPCVDGVRAERVLGYTDEDLLEEEDWLLFAQATAAAGVASTLTLPIVAEAEVVGSVNLYASGPRAFAGRHEAIADIFEAWAPGAVANADLSFSTRGTAEQAPRVLREDMLIQVAVGILMGLQDIGFDTALEQLHDAARRAGVTAPALADLVVNRIKRGDYKFGEFEE